MSDVPRWLSRLAEDRTLRRETLPERPAAMLATLTHDRFSGPDWIFERKLDGVRCLSVIDGGAVRLVSRTGQRMNNTYPEVVDALRDAGPATAVLDGEIVAFEHGRTSFHRLQGRMQLTDPEAARRTGIAIHYYLFDILDIAGYDTRRLPQRSRKQLLRQVVHYQDPLRYSAHRNGDGEAYFQQACARGWEGLVAKRADAPYVGKRSSDWLKFRCDRQQEFIVCGYTPPQRSRVGFGALALGYHEGDAIRYAGLVGTGFDNRMLRDLLARMEKLSTEHPTAHGTGVQRTIRWIKPKLVAQVAFTEWTGDGKLRHPRFLGLRTDKSPQDVGREEAP